MRLKCRCVGDRPFGKHMYSTWENVVHDYICQMLPSLSFQEDKIDLQSSGALFSLLQIRFSQICADSTPGDYITDKIQRSTEMDQGFCLAEAPSIRRLRVIIKSHGRTRDISEC